MVDTEEYNPLSYPINSLRQARHAIQALHTDLLILGKRIRKTFDDYLETLPEKISGAFRDLGKFLKKSFQVDSLADYEAAAAIYGQELAGALYQLQLSFSNLKIAVIQAAAPIVQVFLPVVQVAVRWLTTLAQSIGYVLRMLFFGTAEVEHFSSGIQGAVSAGKSLKRTLAGFDEINRLTEQSGSGISFGDLGSSSLQPLGGAWKELSDRILELLAPLKEIDLGPAAESLNRLREALKPITKALFSALEWAIEHVFIPLAEWTVETLLPEFLDTLSVAMENLSVVIEQLKPYFNWLWEECLKPWAQWKAGQIIEDLRGIQDGLNGVSGWAGANKGFVDGMVQSGKNLIGTLGGMAQESAGLSGATDWASVSLGNLLAFLMAVGSPLQSASLSTGILTQSVGSLATAFTSVGTGVSDVWTAMRDLTANGWTTMKQKFLDPLSKGLEESFNGTVGLLNGLLSGAAAAVNFLVRSMNAMSFSVPEWVPLLGGKSFSFNLKPVTAPVIPELARGAVLPANKPFMAVVGDQRHGTNVEAPLSVIQEAVAAVMADYAASNLAGHEATVAVLQELLAAVLGISISDGVIADAVDRYDRKMAVVRGGYA